MVKAAYRVVKIEIRLKILAELGKGLKAIPYHHHLSSLVELNLPETILFISFDHRITL
jgi:hypothetical protein